MNIATNRGVKCGVRGGGVKGGNCGDSDAEVAEKADVKPNVTTNRATKIAKPPTREVSE